MDPVRKLRWLPAALVAAALVATFVLTACGEEEKREGAEGEFITVGETDYQVQLTRLLNPRQRPDDAFLRGQAELPADEAYLGVFLRIENDGDEPYRPPRDMKVIDTQGNEFLPLDTVQSGFGLDFGSDIPGGDVAPPPNSPASFSPTSGALVLFRVQEDSATDNLPLVLEIPVEGEEEPARITLDV
ncbi:MAG TPA: hypothetical protein VFB51_06725 [Solirubrobacterales bacterium]|nr:hypothetical protein [Solirubrobacterales bacterium]